MYCPRCGKENHEKQRFCNSCGLRLESISNAIADDSTPSREDRIIGGLRGGHKCWQDPLLYAFLLIATGMLIGFIGYKVLSEKTLGDIGTLVSLVGVLVILLKGIILVIPSDATSARTKAVANQEREADNPAEYLPATTPALLAGERPSITEHTTKHLEPSTQDEQEKSRITQPTLQ